MIFSVIDVKLKMYSRSSNEIVESTYYGDENSMSFDNDHSKTSAISFLSFPKFNSNFDVLKHSTNQLKKDFKEKHTAKRKYLLLNEKKTDEFDVYDFNEVDDEPKPKKKRRMIQPKKKKPKAWPRIITKEIEVKQRHKHYTVKVKKPVGEQSVMSIGKENCLMKRAKVLNQPLANHNPSKLSKQIIDNLAKINIAAKNGKFVSTFHKNDNHRELFDEIPSNLQVTNTTSMMNAKLRTKSKPRMLYIEPEPEYHESDIHKADEVKCKTNFQCKIQETTINSSHSNERSTVHLIRESIESVKNILSQNINLSLDDNVKSTLQVTLNVPDLTADLDVSL